MRSFSNFTFRLLFRPLFKAVIFAMFANAQFFSAQFFARPREERCAVGRLRLYRNKAGRTGFRAEIHFSFGLEALASRALASGLEAIASRLEAIAIRLEAIAIGLEAIAIRLGPLLLGWRPSLGAGSSTYQRCACAG